MSTHFAETVATIETFEDEECRALRHFLLNAGAAARDCSNATVKPVRR